MRDAPTQQSPGIVTAVDYEWLIHQCAFLAGDDEIAADLTQETLVEAWRNRHKLIDPEGRRAWLAAIARHIYQRWQRRRFRDSRMLAWIDATSPEMESVMAGEDDLARDLERDELATLLDRAMALLSPDLRLALVAHYVEEQPQQAIAAQLGISQGTLAVRLHRGKLALRQIFATNLHDEADAYGLAAPREATWVETRQWCPICGERRLRARYDVARQHLQLSCAACGELLNHQTAVVAGTRTYQSALERVLDWADTYFPAALATGAATCLRCGRVAPLRHGKPGFMKTAGAEFPSVHIDCSCWVVNTCDLPFVAMASPMGRAFRKSHPRMRLLGQMPREVASDDTMLIAFASITDTAQLNLVVARDTYRVIAVTTTNAG